jgi:hypothetical protein
MPTWMLTEETVTLGSSLPEAYTCAGRVINWDLHINNVDMLTNKKWVIKDSSYRQCIVSLLKY